MTLSPGDKVRVVVPPEHPLLTTRWYPQDGATGTVQRVFKNGTAAVAINEVRNLSADGVKTLHVPVSALSPLSAAPEVAWERAETEPCEKGTVGCSVKHPPGPETECEPW